MRRRCASAPKANARPIPATTVAISGVSCGIGPGLLGPGSLILTRSILTRSRPGLPPPPEGGADAPQSVRGKVTFVRNGCFSGTERALHVHDIQPPTEFQPGGAQHADVVKSQ